ncbi:MAG: hypothetical protein SVZ03_06110 [Spirochaetota bacterium]|nr:hypothetical protein [Spirochaetota bacterium]
MIRINDNTIIIDNTIATLEDKRDLQIAFIRLMNEGYDEIRIDMMRTSHLPSELIGFLLDKKREMLKNGMIMKIIAINETLRKLFDNIEISKFLNL